MTALKAKKWQILSALLILVVLPLIMFFVLTRQDIRKKLQAFSQVTRGPVNNQRPGGGASYPVLSRNVPAFASSEYQPASYANDDSYDTEWRSYNGTPAWLAYDLSSVPPFHRSKVLVVWYNESFNYDHTINGQYSYNMPQDYSIDVNSAPGGGKPPATGWTTFVSVRGNHYHSRQHLIDMAGNNWIRINVTAVDGAAENYDARLHMDVYDASYTTSADWIFFGDSITAGGMAHYTTGGVKSFAQLINAQIPSKFPVQEDGGIGYLESSTGAEYFNSWLQLFPGKYVAISYGTNDANGCVNPGDFYTNYVTMVEAVLQAGKIPVIPHIPWGRTTAIQNCGPALNSKIDALYKAIPQIIKGPDLWTFFQTHQQLISKDGIHPTDTGFGQYRLQWANAMLKAVF